MLTKTRHIIEAGITEGLHIGAQVYASIDSQPVISLAVGESRPGVTMTPGSLVLWLSMTKPIGAAAILQLVEQGKFALDDSVARYLPAFAAGGKESITIRQLLTHTGGFRSADTMGPPAGCPPAGSEEIVEQICAAPLEADWTIGETAGYHMSASWYVLAEVIRRIDGRPFSRYVREEIFTPLGMSDSWIGMPAERAHAYGERIAILPEMTGREQTPNRNSTPEGIVAGAPGAGGYGPSSELARFYEALLGGGERNGASILKPETVRQMTSRQREAKFDLTFRHTIDWGLGLIINSAHYGPDTVPYGFGPYASPESFGHGGARSSIAFVDPARRLVVVAVMNGATTERRHQARMRLVTAAVYEELDLAG